jgi:hypothetical protein
MRYSSISRFFRRHLRAPVWVRRWSGKIVQFHPRIIRIGPVLPKAIQPADDLAGAPDSFPSAPSKMALPAAFRGDAALAGETITRIEYN